MIEFTIDDPQFEAFLKDGAKIYHPDLTQDKKEQHKIIFQKISKAYNILQL